MIPEIKPNSSASHPTPPIQKPLYQKMLNIAEQALRFIQPANSGIMSDLPPKIGGENIQYVTELEGESKKLANVLYTHNEGTDIQKWKEKFPAFFPKTESLSDWEKNKKDIESVASKLSTQIANYSILYLIHTDETKLSFPDLLDEVQKGKKSLWEVYTEKVNLSPVAKMKAYCKYHASHYIIQAGVKHFSDSMLKKLEHFFCNPDSNDIDSSIQSFLKFLNTLIQTYTSVCDKSPDEKKQALESLFPGKNLSSFCKEASIFLVESFLGEIPLVDPSEKRGESFQFAANAINRFPGKILNDLGKWVFKKQYLPQILESLISAQINGVTTNHQLLGSIFDFLSFRVTGTTQSILDQKKNPQLHRHTPQNEALSQTCKDLVQSLHELVVKVDPAMNNHEKDHSQELQNNIVIGIQHLLLYMKKSQAGITLSMLQTLSSTFNPSKTVHNEETNKQKQETFLNCMASLTAAGVDAAAEAMIDPVNAGLVDKHVKQSSENLLNYLQEGTAALKNEPVNDQSTLDEWFLFMKGYVALFKSHTKYYPEIAQKTLENAFADVSKSLLDTANALLEVEKDVQALEKKKTVCESFKIAYFLFRSDNIVITTTNKAYSFNCSKSKALIQARNEIERLGNMDYENKFKNWIETAKESEKTEDDKNRVKDTAGKLNDFEKSLLEIAEKLDDYEQKSPMGSAVISCVKAIFGSWSLFLSVLWKKEDRELVKEIYRIFQENNQKGNFEQFLKSKHEDKQTYKSFVEQSMLKLKELYTQESVILEFNNALLKTKCSEIKRSILIEHELVENSIKTTKEKMTEKQATLNFKIESLTKISSVKVQPVLENPIITLVKTSYIKPYITQMKNSEEAKFQKLTQTFLGGLMTQFNNVFVYSGVTHFVLDKLKIKPINS